MSAGEEKVITKALESLKHFLDEIEMQVQRIEKLMKHLENKN